MSDLIEQRSAIKFCLRNEISAAETFTMLQKAFGDSTMSQKNVYKWYKDFKEGRERVDDLKTILKDHLGLRKVKSRLVPKTLNFLEKSRCVDVCETMLSDYKDKLKCIIMEDETWIYAYDPKTTDQSSEYHAKGEARPKRGHQSRSNIKVMMTVFFDFRGVVHYEFLPPGQTVNKEYYLSVMRRLREAIRLKRPELWANNSWFLHHDNAPSHTALVLRNHRIRLIWLRVTSGYSQNSRDHSGERVSSRLTR